MQASQTTLNDGGLAQSDESPRHVVESGLCNYVLMHRSTSKEVSRANLNEASLQKPTRAAHLKNHEV